MKFYKVKKTADNKQLPKRLIYVKDELFTEKEVERWNVNTAYCDIVLVPKNKTYWLFGARFENKTNS